MTGSAYAISIGDEVVLRLNKFEKPFEVELKIGTEVLHKLVLEPEHKAKGVGKVKSARLDSLDLIHNRQDPVAIPFFLLDCHNRRGVSLLPESHVSMGIPMSLSDTDVKLSVTAKTGKDVASLNLVLSCRRRPVIEKFKEFLAWQQTAVYGPDMVMVQPSLRRYENKGSSQWKKIRGKKRSRFLPVAQNNVERPCIPCSPMVSLFLAYWFNFNEYFTPVAGNSRDHLAAAAGAIVTVTDKDGNVVSEAKTNGYGDFLSSLGELDPLGAFEVMNGDPCGRDGDIYVCASGGHAWIQVRLGGAFNLPRKFVYGPSIRRGDQLCETGIYRIQASPACNIQIGYQRYRWSALAAKVNSPRTPREIKRVLMQLQARYLATTDPASADGIFVFGGTELYRRNGRLERNGTRIQILCSDSSGERYEPIEDRYRRRIWLVHRNILDPKTGMVIPSSVPHRPTKFWRPQGKHWRLENVNIDHHDCWPITNIM